MSGLLCNRFRTPILYPLQDRQLSLSQIVVEQARQLGRCLMEISTDYEACQGFRDKGSFPEIWASSAVSPATHSYFMPPSPKTKKVRRCCGV